MMAKKALISSMSTGSHDPNLDFGFSWFASLKASIRLEAYLGMSIQCIALCTVSICIPVHIIVLLYVQLHSRHSVYIADGLCMFKAGKGRATSLYCLNGQDIA